MEIERNIGKLTIFLFTLIFGTPWNFLINNHHYAPENTATSRMESMQITKSMTINSIVHPDRQYAVFGCINLFSLSIANDFCISG